MFGVPPIRHCASPQLEQLFQFSTWEETTTSPGSRGAYTSDRSGLWQVLSRIGYDIQNVAVMYRVGVGIRPVVRSAI